MRTILVALTAASIFGCASSPPAPVEKTVADVRCTREIPTGSNIPVTKCRSAEELAREKESVRAAEDAINRSRTGRAFGQ